MARQIGTFWAPQPTYAGVSCAVQNGGSVRALSHVRQSRYVIRLPAILADLCRIVHKQFSRWMFK